MPRIASTTHVPQVIAVSATLGLLAAMGWANHRSMKVAAEPPPVIEIEEAAAPVNVTEVLAVRQAVPPLPATDQLLYVFQIGSELYLKISEDEPAHGKRRLLDDGSTTIASVAAANLPAQYRSWSTKTFILDGGCEASVKDFAVVTRLEGSPSYAGLDDERWTAATAAKAGASQLAARLDVAKECVPGFYGRDASLARMTELETISRPALDDVARSALLATEASADAQIAWAEQGEGSWIEHMQLTTFTRRHPTTGEVFIGIHATFEEMGCGGPDINVWGLFRVRDDGTVETVVAKQIDLYSIERVIDVDNDGMPELLGRSRIGTTVLTTARGVQISELTVPFYGCMC